jgi:hypothetical protein
LDWKTKAEKLEHTVSMFKENNAALKDSEDTLKKENEKLKGDLISKTKEVELLKLEVSGVIFVCFFLLPILFSPPFLSCHRCK